MSRQGEPESVTLPDVEDTISSRENARPPVDDSRVSEEVLGRYEFTTGPGQSIEELGRGGMGRVVAVLDHFVGREVAMKQLLTELTSNPQVGTQASAQLEQRFLREARLTGQLEHPAIVPVYEIGRRNDGSLYYTMTRIRGRTLAEALKTAGSFEARLLLLPSLLTVCQAIAHAHDRGVINRDIKPQNIMLGRFGVTYVLDWGLARAKDERETAVRLAPVITQGLEAGAVGTPSYMSPEQAGGQLELVDERSDVWCLGATMYELLCARPPYSGRTPWDVIADIKTKPWTPVRQLEPSAPADLVAICEKALSKDRALRYPSAAELARDLEAWLQGRRVGAYEYTSIELLSRFIKRQRLVLSVGLAAALALLAVGGISLARIVEERNATRQFAQLIVGDLGERLAEVPGAHQAVEQMWTQVLDFYGRQSEMTPEEEGQVLMARARLAGLQLGAGRIAEARLTIARCLELQPLLPLPARIDHAIPALHCRTDAAQLAAFEGKEEERRRLLERLWAEVEPLQDRFESAPWKSGLSTIASSLADAANIAGDAPRARAMASRGLALQEAALELDPGSAALRREAALTLQSMEVDVFSFAEPAVGLAYGERGIALVRPLASASDFQGLRTLGTLLRQHGMILTWLPGREDEGHALLVEASERLARSLVINPSDVSTMGELGDTWLELGEPAKAVEVLARANAMGAQGDYALSLGFAQLLAGEFEASRATLEKVAPSLQADVGLAACAALTQRPADAAALLRDGAKISAQPTQWPRGAFVRLAATQDSPAARIFASFAEGYERTLVSEDSAERARVFETASAAFDALAAKREH